MLWDVLLESRQCKDLIDVGRSCVQSLSEGAQRSIYTLRIATDRPDVVERAFSTWTYHEDLGRTRDVTVIELLNGLLDGEAQEQADMDAGVQSHVSSRSQSMRVAEVGVFHADLSVVLLERFPNLQVLLVDPYHLKPEGERGNQGWSSKALDLGTERTQPFRDRATHMVQTSVEAAAWVGKGSLDLVFIDGDHSYRAARDDIRAWWPTVRAGGVIAGHDYTFTWPGVVQAVNEFAMREGLHLHFSPEVWWVTRPAARLASDPPGETRTMRGSCLW